MEVVETYGVEIAHVTTGAILRTITTTSADGPTTIYTAAEQTDDGITPGDSVKVTVWQISGRVGVGKSSTQVTI